MLFTFKRVILTGFGFLLIVGIVAAILIFVLRNNLPGSSKYQPGNTEYQVFRIATREEGLYQISETDLKDAGLPAHLDEVDQIKIYHRGKELDTWLETYRGEWMITFYGEALESIYSDENVYWLVLTEEVPGWVKNYHDGENLDAAEDEFTNIPYSNRSDLPENSYYREILLEENNLYKPQVEHEDHWFWLTLTSPETKEIKIWINQESMGTGYLVLDVWGATQSSLDNDHHLIASLNGKPVLDERWDGIGRYTLKAEFEPDFLENGENTLSLSVTSENEGYLDIVFLNQVKFIVPSPLIAEGDRLFFPGSGERLKLGGFSYPVRIYDITTPNEIIEVSRIGEGETFIDTDNGHRYLAVGEGGTLTPIQMDPASVIPDLYASKNGADYLVIGPTDLLEPLEPLMSLRTNQGFKTALIPTDAIYDQFGAGIPEPDSIRRFLNYAVENWSPAPKYLLLVGDASYDPKGYTSDSSGNRLPVFMVDTVYGGQTGSDLGYAQIDGENWKPDLGPDQEFQLAVGRIPARKPSEIKDFVEKVLTYERRLDETGAANTNIVTAIADNQSSSFKADAEHFLGLFNSDFSANLISPAPGDPGITSDILEQFNTENLFVAYFGHGSINMWGKERLFHVEDVENMDNRNNYPIIFNLTCLTGLFTHPTTDSLAEKMLFQPISGAVALLAPTSLTLSNDQSLLVDELVQSYLNSSEPRLGELLRIAREKVPLDTEGKRDVIFTFLLFGDPALRLPPVR